jgi:hypothetical protein
MCGYAAAYVHSFCMLYCLERHVDRSTCLSTECNAVAQNTSCCAPTVNSLYAFVECTSIGLRLHACGMEQFYETKFY